MNQVESEIYIQEKIKLPLSGFIQFIELIQF